MYYIILCIIAVVQYSDIFGQIDFWESALRNHLSMVVFSGGGSLSLVDCLASLCREVKGSPSFLFWISICVTDVLFLSSFGFFVSIFDVHHRVASSTFSFNLHLTFSHFNI